MLGQLFYSLRHHDHAPGCNPELHFTGFGAQFGPEDCPTAIFLWFFSVLPLLLGQW